MVTLSMYFNIKMTVRCWHAYQSVSVTVGEELPYQREGANSKDLFAVAVMTTSYRRLRKISAVCSMHSTRVLYYPCQQPSLIARPRSAFRFHSRVRRAWEQGYQQPLIVVNGGWFPSQVTINKKVDKCNLIDQEWHKSHQTPPTDKILQICCLNHTHTANVITVASGKSIHPQLLA